MSDFEREERYIVIKRKYLDDASESALRGVISGLDLRTEECVVVESDWPNYEHVWTTIEQVADGTFDPKREDGLQSELTAARDEAERLRAELETVHEAFGIGNKSRSLSVLMTNIENVKRFAEYLHAVERKFFMVPGEPDEDYPGCEPEDECLVNSWGSTKDRYLKQFQAAILRKQAEAVEAFAKHISDMADDDSDDWWSVAKNPAEQIEDAKDYAQRLRQQADEADQ